jgi:glucose/arabinose dehydrogenase
MALYGRTIPSEVHEKPDPYIGIEKPVYFEYDRTEGSCVMGGSVYYGNEFPELNGKYLFADYSHNKLFALTYNGAQAEAEVTVLLSNLGGQPVDIPEAPGITGIFPTPDGQILVTIMGDYFEPGIEGKIFRLRQKERGAGPSCQTIRIRGFC